MNGKNLKKCSKCLQLLPLSKFRIDTINKYKDGHKSECKECENKRGKQWRRDNPKRNWVNSTLNSHSRTGYIMNITREELFLFIENKNHCELCDKVLNWELGNKKGRAHDDSPTLDRIDNEQTIDINNIMILCHSCNSTKRNRTLDEFYNYCEIILKRRNI